MPEEPFRPRIVYSMTTIPARLDGIESTVKNVLTKLTHCDRLYLNIPEISARGEKYLLPKDFLSTLTPKERDMVEINRCEDLGPITKIIPTLEIETDPRTLIISLDDDIRLKRDISQILLDKHHIHPDACLSFSGFCVGTFPFNWQFAISNKRDLECDWIQGVHSILFPRGIIDLDKLKNWKPHIFKHDDHRISSFLSSEGIKRISINKSPVKYMYNDVELMRTNPISGSLEFIIQNAKISYQMYCEEIYNKSYPCLWFTSIIGLAAMGTLLAAVTVYLNSFFKGKDIWFIIGFGLIVAVTMYFVLTDSMLI